MTTDGIMIIGHGSRYGFNKSIMELQAQRLRDLGYSNVYIGFNETSSPKITETLRDMVNDGIDKIIALPFFIASGIHMERQIPGKLGLDQDSDAGVVDVDGRKIMVHYERPFGEDPLLSKILFERISELSNGEGNTGVIVIGHGSRLPYNKNTIEFHVGLLSEMGVRNVYPAFNEFDAPCIEDVMGKLISDGMEEIIVLPLFVSAGDHLKNDVPGKIGLKDGIPEGRVNINGRDVTVKYARPIGEDPRLVDVLDSKIRKHL